MGRGDKACSTHTDAFVWQDGTGEREGGAAYILTLLLCLSCPIFEIIHERENKRTAHVWLNSHEK